MLLATWNVNSVRVREERLLNWLSTRQPDVVCLQELKCVNEEFPLRPVEDLGYHVEIHGQRMYNGVALLSKSPMTEVTRGLGNPSIDEEARYIAATIEGVRVMCAYVPAGGENVESPKYRPKIDWLLELIRQTESTNIATTPMVLCGDFNIAPQAHDVALPDKWRSSAVFNDELSDIFERLLKLGLEDTFRMHEREGGHYTWWDYNDLCYQRNEGLRIDHILIPTTYQDRCLRCWIDWREREGSKPSDHAPVLVDLDWAKTRTIDGNSSGATQGRTNHSARVAEAVYGEAAAREFVRSSYPAHARELEYDCTVQIRWANGYVETLRWNYFPAGARSWKSDRETAWHEIEQS